MISLQSAENLLHGMRPKPELLQFARALQTEIGDGFNPLDFLETVSAYAHEFASWVNAGRPDSGFLFPQTQDPARELDVDMDAARDAFLAETCGLKVQR